MKKLTYFFIISIICFVVSSCVKNEKDIEFDYLYSKIDDFDIDDDKDWVVILPGLGCKGCIQEGEEFMRQNVKNNNVLFVLTKVESLKLLQYKTGVNIKNFSNIHIDKDNYFNLPTDNIIYPVIIKIEDKKLHDYQFQSPENGMAFLKLSDILKSNSSK